MSNDGTIKIQVVDTTHFWLHRLGGSRDCLATESAPEPVARETRQITTEISEWTPAVTPVLLGGLKAGLRVSESPYVFRE